MAEPGEVKNLGGRPTKYNPDVQDRAEAYLRDWKNLGDNIPSVVGLACELQVSKQTVLNWGKEHPKFFDTLKDIEAAQERESLAKGLDGTFNSTITKLVLANHGYSDKSEVDNKSSDGSMTPKDTVTVIERIVTAPPKQNDTPADNA